MGAGRARERKLRSLDRLSLIARMAASYDGNAGVECANSMSCC